ncbi:hypothetical protein [Ulvibacterium marinum]|uniref:hypothetical protein n=1 Tax=Ulvibacterium marinum TaxID=2419782 RepID=UPI002494D458|nr:hypothetical protein [Ulvibacterium marinum]
MSQFIIKVAKVGLLALLPLFLISNYRLEVPLGNPNELGSKYILEATGVVNTVFEGKVRFETSIKEANNGTFTSTLVLKLENVEEGHQHAVEFLISRQDSPNELPVGTYKVTKNIEGFMDSFDGIFGYANFKALGELPFFAKQGTITISGLHDDFLQGSLEITMYNADEQEITISGSFVASPL